VGSSPAMEPEVNQALLSLLGRLPGRRVAVVGDAMLDEYVWGEARRISPEAPVPVVEVRQRTFAPGGCGNVAVNVASLGGAAELGAVVGSDPKAGALRDALLERGVSPSGLVIDTGRPTTTKTRIVAHNQQIARIDCESRAPLPCSVEDALLGWAAGAIGAADACVLSDYAKGVVSNRLAAAVIDMAALAGKPVVVDPKGRDLRKYRGATVVTPNVAEAEQAANRDINHHHDVEAVGSELQSILGGSAVLITRGAEGMSLFCDTRASLHIPAVARAVYDVTGAGDTVVGVLALALGAGASFELAARLANLAAGIAVGKLGAAAVTPAELLEALSADGTRPARPADTAQAADPRRSVI